MLHLRGRPGWRVLVLGTLILLIGFGLVRHQQLTDAIRLHGYTPTSEIESIATSDAFTPAATHLFYINRPIVVAKSGFSRYCNVQSERTIVLGCYHGVQNGIYILRVAGDSRLDGVMQVTSAHEMLHAAYDRLSAEDRKQVDGWLQDYYKNDLKDERIKATIDAYKHSEPDAVVNEMHSIFGTELTALPPNLEHYYARYFTDRQKVTVSAGKYQGEFIQRQTAVKAYDAQLSVLKAKVTENEATLKLQAEQLKSDAADMNQLRQNGQNTAYNARVDSYNSSVATYNTLVSQTRSMIEQYNQLVTKRNAVALEQQQLTKELSGENIQSVN
jgi:hypothetical protein